MVLTGDPPADPQLLRKAFGDVLGAGSAVSVVSCGPELTTGAIEGTVNAVEAASSVFIFEDFERLSDAQVEPVCKGMLRRDHIERVAILLARPDFSVRLERRALAFLKERIAAQFYLQEIGDEETIAFLQYHLLAQRDRRAEARGFRRGILIGVAAGGAAILLSTGILILHPPPSAPPSKTEDTLPAATPSTERAPASPRLSAAEVSALLARGDEFLRTGDITSARLFYERAADAESGLAALRLGRTFDPAYQDRIGSHTVADLEKALYWYRRARDLGVNEAEQRMKALGGAPPLRR